MKMSKNLIYIMAGFLLLIVPVAASSLASVGTLTVIVTNSETGGPIPDAAVYVFDNSAGVRLPQDALTVGITDASGATIFPNLSGLYYVAIIKEGFTSDRSVIIYPDQPDEVAYSYWGFCGVGVDLTYAIVLENGTPTNNEPELVADAVGLVATLAGFGLLGFGGYGYLKEKKKI